MSFFNFYGIKFCVLVLLLDFVTSTETSRSPAPRGLRNVIRVGKRYGDEELWDFTREEKRFGKLMAFPRVGRSSTSWSSEENTEKRSDSNTGMWFGPRIGRSSPALEDCAPCTYILWNNEKALNRLLNHINSRGLAVQGISTEKNPEENNDTRIPY